MNALLKQLLLGATLACSLVTTGFAQQYPNKTVKIVVNILIFSLIRMKTFLETS